MKIILTVLGFSLMITGAMQNNVMANDLSDQEKAKVKYCSASTISTAKIMVLRIQGLSKEEVYNRILSDVKLEDVFAHYSRIIESAYNHPKIPTENLKENLIKYKQDLFDECIESLKELDENGKYTL